MTIMVMKDNIASIKPWTVEKARAQLSQVIEQALTTGPQTITRNGRDAVVVVLADEWERKTKRKGSVADFFAESPLRNSGLVINRDREKPRETLGRRSVGPAYEAMRKAR
jgi:prevent-host-death family protein